MVIHLICDLDCQLGAHSIFSKRNITPHKPTMKTISLFPRTASLLGMIALASATSEAATTTIFSYDSTGYISGADVNLQGDTGIYLGGSDQYGEPDGQPLPSSLVGRAFSSGTAFSPTIAVGYSGPTFYGGGSVTSTDPAVNEGFHELGIHNVGGGGGGGDGIHWHVDSNNNVSHSNHVFILFKKDQFESAWNSTTIGSGDLASTSFQMHTGQVLQSGPQDLTMYWVVQDGSQFYVGQSATAIAQNSPYQTDFSSIGGWASYDPSVGLAALDFDEGSTFSPHTFTDVQGLGFYVEHEDGASSTHAHIDSFVVSSSIPEPSQSLLVIFGLGGMLLRRGKRS